MKICLGYDTNGNTYPTDRDKQANTTVDLPSW